MYETLLRPHEVHTVPSLTPIGEVSKKLKQQEMKREHKRLQQIASTQRRREIQSEKKRKRSLRETEESKEPFGQLEAESKQPAARGEPGTGTKKLRTGEEIEENFSSSLRLANNGIPPVAGITEDSTAPPCTTSTGAGDHSEMAEDPERAENSTEREVVTIQEPPPNTLDSLEHDLSKMNVSRVINEVRGHTSYLTFAVLLPSVLPDDNLFLLQDSAISKEAATIAVESTHPKTN